MTRRSSRSSATRTRMSSYRPIARPIPPRAPSSPRRCRRFACSTIAVPTGACVLIGDQAWPVPIPLVREKGAWRFATEQGARRAHQPPHRRQRAQRDPRAARLPRRAAPVRVARSRWRQRAAVRAEARQHARQAGRPVLAGRCRQGRRAESLRAAGRRERGVSQGAQGGRCLPRLPFQDPHPPGQECAGRRVQLHHQRAHDRRLRDGRVSRAVWRQRRDDVHREQQRQDLREGSRPELAFRGQLR